MTTAKPKTEAVKKETETAKVATPPKVDVVEKELPKTQKPTVAKEDVVSSSVESPIAAKLIARAKARAEASK